MALALAASGYLIYQWLTRPIPDAFARGEQLLKTDTAVLSAIRVTHSSGEILTYSRESDRWLASNGQQSTWVDRESMNQLLRAITQLQTGGMVPEGPQQGTSVQVSLFGESPKTEAFQLLRSHPDTVWFGFDKLPEKYVVPPELVRPFFRTLSYYRPPRLLEWDSPDSLALIRDSLRWMFYRTDSSWTIPTDWGADSSRLSTWVRTLPDHEAPEETAPYDQQLPDSLVSRQIFVWDGGEQIRLNVFYRNEKWGIWSSQTPDQWYPELAAPMYQIVFPPWLDSLITQTQTYE